MAYLTFKEWKEFGFADIEEKEFERLEKKAAIALDNETRYFYRKYNLDSDSAIRRLAFKHAMALTIEQMFNTGITSLADKLALSSISLGRTSISVSKDSLAKFSLVPSEAIHLLSSVGLLYKGVPYV